MTQFSTNEIAGLIYLVGGWGPGTKDAAPAFLDTAIAVCLAESGGVVEASNPSGAAGLWQIVSSQHQQIVAVNSLKFNHGTITNPLVNTSCARDVWLEAGSWSPWTAYNNGKYKTHRGHGKAAYKWISKKQNLETFRDKLKALGYGIVTISQEDIANANSPIVGPNLVGDNLNEQVDKAKSAVSNWTDKLIDASKQAGVVIGIFVLGLLLLLAGILIFANRAGVAKKVPGPIGLVANAVKK